MSTDADADTDADSPAMPAFWRAIAFDEFDAPNEPPAAAMRLGLQDLWARLRLRKTDTILQPEELPELKSAPATLLDRWVAPPDDLPDMAEVVEPLLDAHHTQQDEVETSLVFVTPPFRSIHTQLIAWATRHRVPLVSPPTSQQILQDSTSWIAQWPQQCECIVIPQLEKFFLRHYHGLDIVRWLVDTLWQTRQRCIITCDSWAWAFLSHASPTSLLDLRPLTPAPLDATALDRWIAYEVRRAAGTFFTFRRADNGKKVVCITPEDKPHFSPEYLIHLAAYSRGNPQVAWAIWRHSLSIAAGDDPQADIHPNAQAEAVQDRGYTLWVRAWEKIPRPELPAKVESTTAFLLHALLIHNGLTVADLNAILAIPPVEVGRHLQALQVAGMVEKCQDQWQVAAAGYPEVRALLAQDGFLVDAL